MSTISLKDNRIFTARMPYFRWLVKLFMAFIFLSSPMYVKVDAAQLQNKDNFGHWTLSCKEQILNATDCAITQSVRDTNDKRLVVKTSLYFSRNYDLELLLRVEPAPIRSEGVSLLIDGQQVANLDPGQCDVSGCMSRISALSDLTSKIILGSTLDVQYNFGLKNGVSLSIDLQDIDKALNAMRMEISPSFGSGWNSLSSNFGKVSTDNVFLIGLADVSKTQNTGFVYNVTSFVSKKCSRKIKNDTILPLSAEITIDGSTSLVSFGDSDRKKLSYIISATKNCGESYAVTLREREDQQVYSSYLRAIKDIQRLALEDYIKKTGIDDNKIWSTDYLSNVTFRKPSMIIPNASTALRIEK